ncbi:MAG TPA: glutamate racemase [Acidobacteriota bacterium]|nr:glutamate racemase [Acidobacteriota bacterium]HMZ78448.1 glutamate racemase [Acidobacteriota bacterium]HNB72477.1 glutamate racemase [Acidobacteriota bacterium]HNH81668.1 glutamate racemase [Acidobacteriota bacterium]HNJ39557.1 glutamate racemase [Acidobacteriota bacterium]
MTTSTLTQPNQPIGIFDSGVGGLTVYRAIREQLPFEDIVYLGDTARIPYGTRSLVTVRRYALEDAAFLVSCGIKLLVVACNTASSTAMDVLTDSLSIPVIGMIGPGAQRAVNLTRNGRIGVIGTEATVGSGAYTRAIHQLLPEAVVIERSCPLFVPLTEEGWASHQVTALVAEEYLKPFARDEIDTLVLGCTHYPILRTLIQQVVGENVHLVDSGASAAEEVLTLLSGQELASPNPRAQQTRFCVTDTGQRFRRIAEIFLGHPMDQPESVDLWALNNDKVKLQTDIPHRDE